MSVKTEVIEKNVVELEVTVEAAKFSAAVSQAAKRISQKVNIPGFRKGKAPRRLIEAYVGKETLYNEAVEHFLGGAYAEAVKESGIEPVDQPDLDLVQVEDGKEFIFKAKVTVKPEVQLGEYKGLQIEKGTVNVTPEQVEEDLKRKQDQHAKLQNLEEGTVQDGDTAVIDFEGFIDGVAFPGGKGENYNLLIGSGTFIPGFEEQLIGAEVGRETEVNVQFPAEYHNNDLAGKKALFKVKVNMIKRKELAPLDDEFAKDISDFETLAELKADIKEKLEKAAAQRMENEYRQAIIAKATDNASVEIPEVMIKRRMEQMYKDFERNLSYQGIGMEQYLAYMKTNEQDFREQFRPQAAETVKTELVLEQIAKTEGIAVTPEEIDEELKQLAELYKQDVAVIKKSLTQSGEIEYFRQSLVNQKTIKFLVEHNV